MPEQTMVLLGRLADSLDSHTASLHELALTVAASQAEQSRLARRTRFERLVALAALVLLAIGAAVMAVGVLSVRSITSGTNENSRILIDCTTPGHACYQRGQQATATAIEQIITAQTVSAWCGAHSVTLQAARACAARHLR